MHEPSQRVRIRRRLLAYAFCGALAALGVQARSDLFSGQSALHNAAASSVVCHAIPKTSAGTERYFCSAHGCYSDEDSDITVVGSYEDEDTCRGIAGSLQQVIKN